MTLGRAKVVAEYSSRSEDGLRLRVGDVVEILERHDTGWWFGRCNGKQGLFPCSRVEEDGASSMPKQRLCVAIFDFEAQDADELGFKKDEVIILVSKSKSGWWKGRIGTRVGIFPANRVREEGLVHGKETCLARGAGC